MKKISLIFILFIFSISFSQINKIEENLHRIVFNNKVGFTNSNNTVLVVPFIYEVEPSGKRNIARYIAIDTLEIIDINKPEFKITQKIIDLDNTNYFDSVLNNESSYSWKVNDSFNRLDDSWTQPNICENFFSGGNGFYAVIQNDKYGYINTKGELSIPIMYESADDFKFIQSSYFEDKNGYYLGIVKKNGKYGVINQYNETLLDFVFDDIIFYKDYHEHGFYRPTYYCIYNEKIFYITFNNGKFELPFQIKK